MSEIFTDLAIAGVSLSIGLIALNAGRSLTVAAAATILSGACMVALAAFYDQ